MSTPQNKFDHHSYESIAHNGFLETLDRCTAGSDAVNFDTPEFVQCVKASAINYGFITPVWLRAKNQYKL